jgi:hypothetical protein
MLAYVDATVENSDGGQRKRLMQIGERHIGFKRSLPLENKASTSWCR